MRRKGVKRTAALFLAAVISIAALAGCGNSSNNSGRAENAGEETVNSEPGKAADSEVSMGRYMEEEIELPEVFTDGSYLVGTMRKEEGKIRIYGISDFRKFPDGLPAVIYQMNPDGGFEDITPKWLKEHKEEGYRGQQVRFLPNGDAHVFYDNKNAGIRLKYYRSETGTLEETEIKLPGFATGIEVMENGVLLLYDGGTVWAYQEGETEFSSRYDAMTPVYQYDADTIITRPSVSTGMDGYQRWNAYDGTLIETITPEEIIPQKPEHNKRIGYDTWVYVEEEGIYVLVPGGIYYRQEGTQTWQQLVDGATMPVLGNGSEYCAGMAKGYEDDFYAVFENKLYRYQYDADVITVPDKSLRIYSLEENKYVRKAVNQFIEDNPDYYVEYQTAEEGIAKEDAIKKLNVEIAGGNGPDVLVLDGLPQEVYMEKGVLMELGGMIDELTENGNYYEDIVRTYQTEKGVYSAVSRFTPVFAAGSKEIMPYTDSLGELADYVQKNTDIPVFIGNYYKDQGENNNRFLRMLYTYYGKELYQEDGRVTEKALEQWLEDAKVIYQNAFSEADGANGIEAVDIKMFELYDILEKKKGSLTFIPHDFLANRDVAQAKHFEGYTGWYTGKYIPGITVGVGAYTKFPEKAQELAAALFSKSCQEVDKMGDPYLAVSKEAARLGMEEFLLTNNEIFYNPDLDAEYPVYPASMEDLEWYLSEAEMPGTALDGNYTVYRAEPDDMLRVLCELAPDYLEEKKTLESILPEIMNRIELMENE